MLKQTTCVSLVGVVWISVGIALGGDAQPPQDLENIAKGKSYTLAPAPNYDLCADEGDKTQLTDGVYTQGHFWADKSTVGWCYAASATVTIDLGAIQPIRGISYNTAAGAAGVAWPVFVPVLVSDDGKTYHFAGDLVELAAAHGEPPASGYRIHRYWTDQLATHGRFVKLVIVPAGPYIFVDEIEVYRGQETLIGQPLTGQKVDDVASFVTGVGTTNQARHRLRSDLAAVRESIQDKAGKEEWEKELAAIEKELSKMQVSVSEDFRTVLPLNDLHKRIFAVQGAVWRAGGNKPVVVWQKNLWDMLSPTESPLSGGAKVDVAMMQNEWRSAAFNLSNAGTETTVFQLAIDGLPGGLNPKYISVHEVPFTDTKSGVPVAAALPAAANDGKHYSIPVEPGMTKQVWLTVHSKEIPAGEHLGKIVVEPGAMQVPVRLKVYPIAFPDQPTLHLCGWDYTGADTAFDVTDQNRMALIEHLRERFVDSPWANAGAMPYGKYDKEGNLIEPPDASRFEKWIERWPNARMYLVFPNVQPNFAGFEIGTPAFKNAVAGWVTWWVGQLAKWNIQPDQLGLLLVDEPSKSEQNKVIVEYAKVIRKAQPKVVVWNDPIWNQPWNAEAELYETSTVLCPNLPMWIANGAPFANFFVKQRDAGRELWFYSCSGPGKLLDPYAYHRMQQWYCWKYDAKGSGFWAFGDSSGASSWNEYVGGPAGAYTPLFLDTKTVTAGKHMEAIREGIEDYEYLRILRDRVAELEKKGVQGDGIANAKKLLETAADRVIACMKNGSEMNWSAPKDRSIADQVRVEVLDALMALKAM